MAKKQCLLIVSLVTLLGLMPRGAWAYHEDIHFNLTYVLCRLSGLSANDALWIADADQSMDDNSKTTAYGGLLHTPLSWRYNGLMWHDFCDDGCTPDTKNAATPGSTISFAPPGDMGVKARAYVRARYNALWTRIKSLPAGSDDRSRITADIALGQFLHYEQDFYAHRQFTSIQTTPESPIQQEQEENDNTYWPYGTKWGHSADGDGKTADQVKLRPYLAKIMIADCYDKIEKFAFNRGISSPSETAATLAPLIDAIVAAYGPGTIEQVSHRVITRPSLIFQKYITYEFPTQTTSQTRKSVNDELLNCLTTDTFLSSAWPQSAKLPIYVEGGGELNLPYDHPDQSLDPWIKKIKTASDAL